MRINKRHEYTIGVFNVTEQIQHFQFGDEVANELISTHGPLISGEDLWKTIGFTSAAAFRQARAQERLEITVFSLPNRRGTFAFTKHVADWLKNLAKEVHM